VLYDKDHYKLALGQLNTAKNLIDKLAQGEGGRGIGAGGQRVVVLVGVLVEGAGFRVVRSQQIELQLSTVMLGVRPWWANGSEQRLRTTGRRQCSQHLNPCVNTRLCATATY
jgi:hypothetical protein